VKELMLAAAGERAFTRIGNAPHDARMDARYNPDEPDPDSVRGADRASGAICAPDAALAAETAGWLPRRLRDQDLEPDVTARR
jgi:hypothetical protein